MTPATPPLQDKPPAATAVTFFLDLATEPFPATLYLNDERLGRAPLKKTVTLTPGQAYQIHADYELDEVHDIYRETQSFTVKGNEDVVTFKFKAALAKINVLKLPRHADFYWSGFYAYDTAKTAPVLWQRVSYGRPVYLPYGDYRLELRETAPVSGSTNPVSRVTYQRDYALNADVPEVTISVFDEDLQRFPAKIKSQPASAEIFLNDQKIGITPFDGFLPVGTNRLVLKKNGFFDEEQTIAMTMNAPYETTVTLKTSKVGEKLLQAREFLRLDQDDQAIEVLIDALKYGGSDSEKPEVYFILGQVYLKKNQVEVAESYFQRAEGFAAWRDRAKLALTQVIFRKGDTRAALAKLSEVMVGLTDDSPSELRQEATNVFKKISPVHSAIYVYSEPAGARVLLNDKLLDEQTPLLFSGLGLGHYRIQVEKDGYDTYTTKQNLKISDFVIVKVKLKKSEL